MYRLMKKIPLLIILISLYRFSAVADEIPKIEWKTEVLNPGTAYNVSLDDRCNAYITGFTNGDLGGTNAGGKDAIVVKYDSLGKRIWIKQFGTSGNDEGINVAVDEDGNCYVCGVTEGNIDGESKGKKDAFIAKLSSSGKQLWIRQLGTSEDDNGKKIIFGLPGQLYFLGTSTGTFDSTEFDCYNAFVAKYDSAGNRLWLKQPYEEMKYYSAIYDLAIDENLNIYLTGDPGYLAKCDSSGKMIWEKKLDNKFKNPWGIELEHSGIINVTGWTSNYTAFINKYDNEGECLWSRTFIKNGWSCPKVVVSYKDTTGNILIGGCQGAGGTDCDGFMCKYTKEGDKLWTIENNFNHCGNSVAVDQYGNSYLTGGMHGGSGTFLIKVK